MIRKIIIPIARLVMTVLFRPEIYGKENIPKEGGYILAANHLSFWDPIFVGAFLTERKINFMAKAELFRFKPFGALISACGAMPVNRGTKDASAVLNTVELLKSGNVLGIFPEGTRVRKGKKSNPKKGTVRMAQMAAVPIIPITAVFTVWMVLAPLVISIVSTPCRKLAGIFYPPYGVIILVYFEFLV